VRLSRFAVLALIVGASLPSVAHAEQSDDLVFADKGKAALDWGDAQRGTVVTLCNVGSRLAENLEFRLAEFALIEDNGARATATKLELVLDGTPVGSDDPNLPVTLAAGACSDLRLRGKEGAKLDALDYPGVIIATASSGIARKSVTVTNSEAAATTPARGETLSPDDLADQTLPATNFAPSFLNPYGPTLIVIALAGLLVAWVYATELGGRFYGGLAAIAIMVAIFFGLFGHTFWDRDDQQGWSLISPKSLPVAGVADGTYGVVTDDEADIAKLVVAGGRLVPEGLERAGAYSGKLDLTPGVDKGDATVKVNVRDWWLWAFAIIALGVFVGYCLRRLFQSILPRDKLIAQTYRLAADTPLEIPDLPEYSIERPVKDAVARIARLARSDLETGKTAFTTLKTDLEAYVRMSKVLLALRARLTELEGLAKAAGYTELDQLDGLAKARGLLARPLVVFDKAEYDKRVEVADAADVELRNLIEKHQDADKVRRRAAEAGRKDIVDAIAEVKRKIFEGDLAGATTDINGYEKDLGPPKRGAGDLEPLGAGEEPEPELTFQAVAEVAEEPVSLSDQAAEAELQVRERERRGSLVAGALAVASGLSTLYFADGVWGTSGDYLAAALWGAAGSEGLKYVKAVTDRAWGDA
jgi:hypothetical protein